jgi:hypothetical protein
MEHSDTIRLKRFGSFDPIEESENNELVRMRK